MEWPRRYTGTPGCSWLIRDERPAGIVHGGHVRPVPAAVPVAQRPDGQPVRAALPVQGPCEGQHAGRAQVPAADRFEAVRATAVQDQGDAAGLPGRLGNGQHGLGSGPGTACLRFAVV